MQRGFEKSRKYRPPRIRVPSQQKAIFIVGHQKLIGVVQRLSATGGSALLVKGPIAEGTLGEMVFGTVFGKVKAHIEFLHKGADGVPLAQAFAFLTMDATSSHRIQRALEEMNTSDLSDSVLEQTSVFEKLRQSICQLSGILSSARRASSKR